MATPIKSWLWHQAAQSRVKVAAHRRRELALTWTAQSRPKLCDLLSRRQWRVVKPRSSCGVESTCLSEAEVWPECEYTMRFIHSSDWQIGKVFRFVDAETMAVLQEARLDAIGRLCSFARETSAAFIVVAGDIFDQERPSDKTLQRTLARMAAAPSAKWFLLPGNHDPHRPNGLWDRVARLDLPSNIQLLLEAKPISAGEGLPVRL